MCLIPRNCQTDAGAKRIDFDKSIKACVYLCAFHLILSAFFSQKVYDVQCHHLGGSYRGKTEMMKHMQTNKITLHTAP